ncbi:MAG TPA: HepT-like ribonuclease domain-containing protein [Thermoanaerobaculia bacterium]|nr:HepT-like ribonuclease domain-containing protein [Thermoanaerobaculia bacterium]
MSGLDRAILAEKASAIERHLARVADRLPTGPEQFQPSTDASDAVILHLWQAVQATIDLALAACLLLHLGTPNSYAEAFERLTQGGYLDPGLAERLTLAAGFRNVVAHMYDRIDMNRVYRAAQEGPADLRAFLARLRDLLV